VRSVWAGTIAASRSLRARSRCWLSARRAGWAAPRVMVP